MYTPIGFNSTKFSTETIIPGLFREASIRLKKNLSISVRHRRKLTRVRIGVAQASDSHCCVTISIDWRRRRESKLVKEESGKWWYYGETTPRFIAA
ncbi:uncharacterized protein G2W53_034348 [Senna tora]|uniref:Uncharacterized protein n=1 Tax=Senna tora TaxID=362788 RepID=A0A834T1Q2_9FABA|nr:uncharacterized protein G2W53_034348 [Senna tora]